MGNLTTIKKQNLEKSAVIFENRQNDKVISCLWENDTLFITKSQLIREYRYNEQNDMMMPFDTKYNK